MKYSGGRQLHTGFFRGRPDKHNGSFCWPFFDFLSPPPPFKLRHWFPNVVVNEDSHAQLSRKGNKEMSHGRPKWRTSESGTETLKTTKGHLLTYDILHHYYYFFFFLHSSVLSLSTKHKTIFIVFIHYFFLIYYRHLFWQNNFPALIEIKYSNELN